MPDVATEQEQPTSWMVGVLRAYIATCSLPLQGPQSGALRWVTRTQALRVLDLLGERAESNGVVPADMSIARDSELGRGASRPAGDRVAGRATRASSEIGTDALHGPGPSTSRDSTVAWCHYCGRPIPHGKACRYHRDLLALDPVYLLKDARRSTKGTATR